ncbi:MAG: 50S ribosomal protein L25 [Anaerolineae bacterium]|jgi:large subunit ribosomal protein L25
MAQTLALAAQTREAAKTPRALRREGIIPGVLYGNKYPAVSLQFSEPALRRLLETAGTTHLFTVNVPEQGLSEMALVRAVQRDPVTGNLWHVDLYRVVADQEITTEVPLRLEGEAPVEQQGGVVNQLLTHLEVSCLPADLPDHIVVDISSLVEMDSAIYISDLVLPARVTALADQELAVVRVVVPRSTAEAEEGEEAEGAEDEQAADAEGSDE